jgi:hypothetical protein
VDDNVGGSASIELHKSSEQRGDVRTCVARVIFWDAAKRATKCFSWMESHFGSTASRGTRASFSSSGHQA